MSKQSKHDTARETFPRLWERVHSEYTYKEAKQRLKEYRENGGGCYRLEKRREKKEVL